MLITALSLGLLWGAPKNSLVITDIRECHRLGQIVLIFSHSPKFNYHLQKCRPLPVGKPHGLTFNEVELKEGDTLSFPSVARKDYRVDGKNCDFYDFRTTYNLAASAGKKCRISISFL